MHICVKPFQQILNLQESEIQVLWDTKLEANILIYHISIQKYTAFRQYIITGKSFPIPAHK